MLFNLMSQDSIYRYYNDEFEKTSKSRASYFRVLDSESDDLWMVRDYSTAGTLIMSGTFSDQKTTVKEGEFLYYYSTGHLKKQISYNANVISGDYVEYYEDGIKNFQGKYKNGRRDGMWKWYFEQGTISWYEQWRNDTLIHIQCWNKNGQELESDFPPQVDAFIAGGSKSLYFFIEDNFTYPNSFQDKAVKIKINVLVSVSKTGELDKVVVKNTKYDWVEIEIQRVFRLMSLWYPALDHMRPQDSVVEIPLMFKKFN
jgi:hypothetical protein